MDVANIVVIGAGVVGLSIAANLSEKNDSVYVLEKNRRIGQEISSHNSGVIHSGIHYPKGSLKARLCIEGNRMIYDLCERYGIPYKRLGKLTVARGESEIKEIEKLMKTGNENGTPGIKLLSSQEVQSLEPNVEAEMALLTPSSGIIEPDDLISHFGAVTSKNGAIVANATEVKDIRRSGSGYELSGVSAGQSFRLHANTVINSAGLNADRIASMIGLDVDSLGYRIRYCKGDYFRVSGPPPVRMLIYPVPKGAGLGIHLTPDMAGSVKLGPNSYFVDKLDYNVESNTSEFRDDVSKYLPSIVEREIQVDSSGIRPQISGADKSFKDFIIKHEADNGFSGFINLIGIESPGLTASPAIGEYVTEIYEKEIK